MVEAQGMNQVLVAILENQGVRTEAALKGLREDVFRAEPGGDVRAIVEIGRHLLGLRKMKLVMLESKLIDEMPDTELIGSAEDLRDRLAAAAALLREAILAYDPEDWLSEPKETRPGVWGDLPTIVRLSRPFNDFVSHLGSIRTIRRLLGDPV